MIDRDLKRSLGQMTKGVQVVAATHDGITRAYTSHWVCQVSFDEPVVLLSVSPKHDTHPVLEAAGWASVSILAGDQVEQGQYFSYPGHKMRYGEDYLEVTPDGIPFVRGCLAWLRCDVERKLDTALDHDLYLARVTATGEGRIGDDPLVYSSRHGWRVAGQKARNPGESVRDRLLARVEPGSDGSGSS